MSVLLGRLALTGRRSAAIRPRPNSDSSLIRGGLVMQAQGSRRVAWRPDLTRSRAKPTLHQRSTRTTQWRRASVADRYPLLRIGPRLHRAFSTAGSETGAVRLLNAGGVRH